MYFLLGMTYSLPYPLFMAILTIFPSYFVEIKRNAVYILAYNYSFVNNTFIGSKQIQKLPQETMFSFFGKRYFLFPPPSF
jgi:hypothetical protein